MVIALQPTTTTYLDVGGVFPLLTAAGTVDPTGEGNMRQAGEYKQCLLFFWCA